MIRSKRLKKMIWEVSKNEIDERIIIELVINRVEIGL